MIQTLPRKGYLRLIFGRELPEIQLVGLLDDREDQVKGLNVDGNTNVNVGGWNAPSVPASRGYAQIGPGALSGCPGQDADNTWPFPNKLCRFARLLNQGPFQVKENGRRRGEAGRGNDPGRQPLLSCEG